MKEIFYSVFLMFFLGTSIGTILIGIASCEQQQKVEQSPQQPLELSKDSENYYLKVTEYTYEGCEYIKVGYGQSIWGSHKGNCENPIHKGQHPSPYMLEIPKTILDIEDTLEIDFPNVKSN